jgi:signal transduction histidine kinase
MAPFSLRARLLIGAALWTIGLLTLTSILLTHLLFTQPHAPVFFHRLFAQIHVMLPVGLLAMAAGFVALRRGVSPITQLRRRLSDVHEGRVDRLQGDYPAEVTPLVADLNALLQAHERNVARAQAKAGDLAHGLKTPLAILAQEADRARAADRPDLADAIVEQVERMRRQIDYHLAHARAAASSATAGARASLADAAAGLKRALDRLHADRGLVLAVDIPAGLDVRVQHQDLDEMLGNLLDNACQWARSRVTVRASLDGSLVVIMVDDDGPGLAPAMRETVLQRGVRADQAAPGSGLGLAIVRDVAAVYGGSIALDVSPDGGLRAVLRLPAA